MRCDHCRTPLNQAELVQVVYPTQECTTCHSTSMEVHLCSIQCAIEELQHVKRGAKRVQ